MVDELQTAECGDCGRPVVDDRSAAPELRSPCPTCGSTKRKYFVTATATIGIEALASVVSTAKAITDVVSAANLLLQAVVIPGADTKEGQLIEAVALPWFEIVAHLRHNPKIAHEIDPRKWEEIVAAAYRQAGFDEVTLTPRSGDYGRDVIAIKRGLGSIRVIDQVKAYKPGHLVTANDVRALLGVLQGDGASKGFLTTTSDFAPKLGEDPLLVPFMPSRIELINGSKLLARLIELAGRNT